MFCRLLEIVRKPDQRSLTPGATEKRDPGWQRVVDRVAHRHRNGRETGAWGKQLAVVAVRCIEVTDESRWIAPGWIDQCIEFERIHHRRHSAAQ